MPTSFNASLARLCESMSAVTVKMSSLESQVQNSSLEEEMKRTKRKISLSNCSVCGSEEAKYTCPRCLTHSCSLLCVKKHKECTGCSGVRDKTAYVALSRFDEMALLSDYRFLEDTGRFSDGATRDTLIKVPHVTMKAKLLMSNARKMNINLRLLPCTFTKSKENSTVFYSKEKRFMWHLKLIFPQSGAEFTQRRVSDQLTLKQILIPYIHPTESEPVTRQKLKMYVHEKFDLVKVFMKAEGRKANSVRFHELDLHKSLRDNLSYKSLIEYPILHVVLKDHWKEYPLKGPVEQSSGSSVLSAGRANHHEEDNSASRPKTSTVCTGSLEISPELGPPQEKRAKREEEDREEGELTESSDEDEESSSSDESFDAGESQAKESIAPMNVSTEKVADSVDNAVSQCNNNQSRNRSETCSNNQSCGTSEMLSNNQSGSTSETCSKEDMPGAPDGVC